VKVDGPNARELRSILAQLRHLYMLLERTEGSAAAMVGHQRLLSKQIERLESLQRVIFEPETPQEPRQPDTPFAKIFGAIPAEESDEAFNQAIEDLRAGPPREE
jgi:hypothetical protein